MSNLIEYFEIRDELARRGLATFGSPARCKERLQRFIEAENKKNHTEDKHIVVDLPTTDDKLIYINDEDYDAANILASIKFEEQDREVEDVIQKYRAYLADRITTLESSYYEWKLAESKLLEKWIR